MSEWKKESGKFLRDTEGQLNEPPGTRRSSGPDRTSAGAPVVLYDALDRRLMATFPASDATAIY